MDAPRTTRSEQKLSALFALAGSAALLLCGYEFARSASASLFLHYYGANRLPIVMTLGPIVTIALVYGYGALLSRLGARRTLFVSTFISAGVLAVCYAGLIRHIAVASAVLYAFREAYIVILIEQYWSFVDSTVPMRQAKTFNGPLTGIGSLGGIAGAFFASRAAMRLGSEMLVLFAVASIVSAAFLSDVAYRIGGEPQPSAEEAGGRQGSLAIGLFLKHRYLSRLFALILLTQAVSTVLDIRFSALALATHPDKNVLTAYLAGFFALVNTAAFLLQFVVTPLALRFMSTRRVHALIPVVHIGTAAALLVNPSLLTGGVALLVFKAFDYSLFKAAKETLYIPLTYDERYRAKSVIDAFGYRFSKGGVAGLLALAGSVFGTLSMAVYPIVAIAAAGAWLPIVLGLTRPAEPAPEYS